MEIFTAICYSIPCKSVFFFIKITSSCVNSEALFSFVLSGWIWDCVLIYQSSLLLFIRRCWIKRERELEWERKRDREIERKWDRERKRMTMLIREARLSSFKKRTLWAPGICTACNYYTRLTSCLLINFFKFVFVLRDIFIKNS